MKLTSPINYIYTTTHTAEKAYEKVLNYAGASLSRDWVDTLMVYDTRFGKASHTGSGSGNVYGIIDSQNDNKPSNAGADWNAWPTLNSTECPADTDKDGMPDAWETANGLNPINQSDGSTQNNEGYTMLEVYMNSLVSNIMEAENLDGAATGDTVGSSDSKTSTVTGQILM